MLIDTLTPVVDAAPGEVATCRMRLVNDGPGPVRYDLRLVGLDDDAVVPVGPVPAGHTADVALPLAIPEGFAAGRHDIGVEIVSDRVGEPPFVTAITVTVGSIDRVALSVAPSTVRGRRRGRFVVDVHNREATPVDLVLHGEGHDTKVRLEPERLHLRTGERMRVRGRVAARPFVRGELRHHHVTVVATGRSAPSYADATFVQQPLSPRPLRALLSALVIIGLLAGALGGAALWWNHRDADRATVAPGDQLVDTDGDGVPDTPARLVPGGTGGASGTGGAAGGAAGGASKARKVLPTDTLVTGSVKAGDTGDDAEVAVTLTPIDLGAQPSAGATTLSARRTTGKLWPARYGRTRTFDDVRRTESVETTRSGADGAFAFAGVAIRQNYELNFAKAGFDSQSVVVTPPEDGKPVEVNVVLKPARGGLGGVVVAGGAPLGGVAIVVSDGTLTFSTTSSTDASGTGSWAIPRVSTPGVYTLTATARGYGTEVLQVELAPGQVRDDVRIVMTAGVGSISGRVTAGGRPLGGVTLTAANGELTRTTTSVTEGDIGVYNFPQLPVPGTYTVTVTQPGYVTQTREVRLTGAVGGVDFDLGRTTASITGVVVSDIDGPLPGAAVTVTRDQLTFRASSAAAPEPGSFRIDDLPPGTYLLDVSRFDHSSTSLLVTLQAGEVRDLGQILLSFTGRPAIPATGSIVAEVVDSLTQPLLGATVSVVDPATGTVIATLADTAGAQSTFTFPALPVGTYDVVAEKAPVYRAATRRVSVGLGQARTVLTLFKNGQVSGSVVDAITGRDLTDYEVTIFRLANANDTVGQEITRVVVPANATPNADGRIVWETPGNPPILTTGLYRVAVTDAPPGYAVVNDQILDPTLPAGQPQAMRFEIKPSIEAPLVLNDIAARPFPELSGRIYIPDLVDPAGNAVAFTPQDGAITVTLTCPGGVQADVPAVLSDELGPTNAVDTYRFPAALLDQFDLLGACTVTASVAGFEPASTVIDPPLAVSDGVALSNQIVNLAVRPPVPAFGGTLFWNDTHVTPARAVPAVAPVAVRSTSPVITGFVPGTGDLATPPRVVTSPTALSSTSSAGAWSLPGQVFGRTTYDFTAPQYVNGTLVQTLERNGRTVTNGGGFVSVTEQPDRRLDLELAPRAGTVRSTVSVLTAGAADLTGFGVRLTQPNDAAQTVDLVRAANTNVFSAPAAAGSWNWAVTAPPTFVRYNRTPGSGTLFVDPGGTTDIATRFYELGTLSVDVRSTAGVAAVGTTVTVSMPAATIGGVAVPAFTRTATVQPDGTAVLTGLPVGFVENVREGFDRFATVSFTIPGFDTSQATLTSTRTGQTLVTNGTSVSLPFAPGTRWSVAVRLPKFGTTAMRALGELGSPANRVPLRIGGTPPLAVTAVQLQPPFGTPTGVTATVAADPANADGFVITGPPGWYQVTVSHPFYGAGTTVPAGPTAPPFLAPAGLFEIRNDTPLVVTDPFVLAVSRGAVAVSVVDDPCAGGAVGGATVSISQGATVVQTATTAADGTVVLDGAGAGLVPGSYRVQVRVRDANGEDLNFPVISDVTVPLGATPAARTVTLAVAAPRIGGAIAGTVGAVNTKGNAVALPASMTVTRTYTVRAGTANGAPVANQATEADVNRPTLGAPVPALTLAPSATVGQPVAFQFDDLAGGVHRLAWSSATGYTAPTDQTVVVTGVAVAAAPPVRYVAANRSVVVRTVTAGGAAVAGAVVRLVTPNAGEAPLAPTVAGNVHTFAGVAPEIGDYRVTVTRDLYADASVNVSVPPGVGAITVDVTLTPNAARLTGRVLQDTAPGVPSAPAAGATVTLLKTGVPAATATTDGAGAYRFDVTENGSYSVSVAKAGFATRASAAVSITLGNEAAFADVLLPALASVAVTVNGPPTGTATVALTAPATVAVTPTVAGTVTTFAGLDPDLLYQFRATAPGYVSAAVPATGSINPAPGEAVATNVTLTAREISGTVTGTAGAVASAKVVATSGASTLTATTAADGTFRLSPVPPGSWTVVAELLGTGRATRTVTIADDASASVTGVALALVARPLAVPFTLQGPGGALVTATIGTATASGTLPAAGSVTVTVNVTETAVLDWTLAGAAVLTQTGTSALDASADTLNATTLTLAATARTMVARPTIAGTATRNGNPRNGVVVRLCATGSACGTAADAEVAATTTAGGAYTLRPDVGSWVLRADDNGTLSPPVAVTVSAAGTLTPAGPFDWTF